MALNLRKKRRKHLSMTSLIDVIFLLLLFFMLTSTFSKFGEIELTTAAAGGTEPDQKIRFVKLEADRILIDGTLVPLAEVAASLHNDNPQTVLISLDDKATSQQLIDLLTIMQPIGKLRTLVLG